MGVFFAYILKSAICLACFYLFYRWLLSRETFHRFNRIALLGILLVSLLIPFIEVTVKEQTEVNQTVLTIEQLLMMASLSDTSSVAISQPEEISLSWIQIGGIIYLVGIFFFTCRNLYSLSRMCLLLKSGEREKIDKNITMIVHEKDIAPFSWVKYIVISRKDLEENGREILIHECAHIRNRHSWDLLVADICIFFQWFNPGAWLLKQELQNIHEYEADETVIKEGVDAKQYQLLLIKKAVGTRLYSMANSFNHSKLKKRITMMLKEKSNPWARLKYLYVLPLAAIAVTAFARPEVSETVGEISALKVNDLASLVEAKVTESIAPEVKKRNTVVVQDSVRPASEQDKNKETTNQLELGHSYVLQSAGGSIMISGLRQNAQPLMLINGKEVDANIWKAIDPSKVKQITAIADKGELTKYGARGKDGVFEMELYAEDEYLKLSAETRRLFGTLTNIRTRGIPLAKPLIIVDGKETTEEDFSKMNPSAIESFSILKDSSAVAIYGDKGKNGVMLVTMKNGDMTLTANKITIAPFGKGKTITAKGIVTDSKKEPVVGATIVIDGTNTGAVTNKDGSFTLEVPKDATLVISYVGMKAVTTKAASDMVVLMTEE